MKMIVLSILAGFIAVPQANAGYVSCRVADPTGTLLNVRDQPAGNIVGTVANFMPVNRAELVRDGKGSVWAFVQNPKNGAPMGWVFNDYLDCF